MELANSRPAKSWIANRYSLVTQVILSGTCIWLDWSLAFIVVSSVIGIFNRKISSYLLVTGHLVGHDGTSVFVFVIW